MPTKVSLLPIVNKQLKRLKGSYPSITPQFRTLVEQLTSGQRPGVKIPGLGYDVYKVRLPNPSARRGKSGGFRVIYYVQLAEQVVLIAVYAKTHQADIPADSLIALLKNVPPPDEQS